MRTFTVTFWNGESNNLHCLSGASATNAPPPAPLTPSAEIAAAAEKKRRTVSVSRREAWLTSTSWVGSEAALEVWGGGPLL